jgi:hypothetical protein
MDNWVRAQYREAYCDVNGRLIAPKINLDDFLKALKTQRPGVQEVTDAVKR